MIAPRPGVLRLAREVLAPALVAWTAAAPWAFGASDSEAALAGHIAFAMAFVPLALLARVLPAAAATCAAGGLWLAVSPLALGFSSEALLTVNDTVIGWALVACAATEPRRGSAG